MNPYESPLNLCETLWNITKNTKVQRSYKLKDINNMWEDYVTVK